MFKKLKSNSGVTMIELVIVLAIMGILAVTVVPMFSQLQHKSQVSRNLSNMKILNFITIVIGRKSAIRAGVLNGKEWYGVILLMV